MITPESLQDIARSFQKSRIILTGFELGIFTKLEYACLTSSNLAKQINADERATERLLNALTALGLLEKKKNMFCNTIFASHYLVEGKPDYLAGLGHMVHLWQTWSSLTETVIAGKAVRGKDTSERKTEWLKPFIGAMHYRGNIYSDASIKNIDLTDVNKILDLGGGSAAFSMAFVRAKNSVKVTVFDLSDVITLTKEYIAEAGMEKNIDTLKGNYLKDDIGKGYDSIFLSAIVHSNSFEQNKILIKKCADALNVNGRIVIQDFVMNEDRTEPPAGAVFALNMLVGTEAGDTFTEKEIREWFDYAGLKFFTKLPARMGNQQMIAKK